MSFEPNENSRLLPWLVEALDPVPERCACPSPETYGCTDCLNTGHLGLPRRPWLHRALRPVRRALGMATS